MSRERVGNPVPANSCAYGGLGLVTLSPLAVISLNRHSSPSQLWSQCSIRLWLRF